MTDGLFDRYFRLLAGQLPAADYGVIAEPAEALTADTRVNAEAPSMECLC
ncbi:hypothetical protein [Frigoriglobus tundricola]|uniref:Uncharacterized protein n=1 Tax=Frigoriglobus tundricola TaxID=2774151 RepID=A0A6M5YLC5_9BACT|nr:hypothetical protein [Frigoriglobus tundricola]QJW94093.1 hypothetical protein FTUN_1612 [Frigoriglobus tundricola]